MRKDVAHLWNLAEPVVTGAGLEIVELEFTREPGGWVLRLYIDRPWSPGPQLPAQPGQPSPQPSNDDGADHPLFELPAISFEDCERVSRDISAALDVADVITHAYRLEVSSPGIDRPLRRERDFQRWKGRQAKVRTVDAVEGRRNFSGILRGAHEGVVEIECDGRPYRLPVDSVVRASLVPDWTAEFRKAERSAS